MSNTTCAQSSTTPVRNSQEDRRAGVASALGRLRATLDDYRFNPDAEGEATLRVAVRELAELMQTWPARESNSPAVRDVLPTVRVLWSSGLVNQRPPTEDLEFATKGVPLGWPGLIAAMLMTPAWAWDDAPCLGKVPDWLWGDYVHWVLTPPRSPTESGIIDAHFARITACVEELAGWMERNRGSAAVRAAGESFLDLASSQQPLLTTMDLKDYALARGRLIKAIARTRAGDAARLVTPRDGRPLRVGVMARSFADSHETRGVLAVLQKMDPQKVCLVLLTATYGGSPLEQQFRQVAEEFQVLPASREERLEVCGRVACDVLLYAADMVGITDDFTGLAVQRLAPLQGVLTESLVTTGLAEMDLRFIGANTVEPSSERLALLPGAGLCLVEPDLSNEEAAELAPGRDEFGLPDAGPVFVSAARAEVLSIEILKTWARLLTAVPDASLLVLQPASEDPFLAEELPARFERLFGIDPGRVVVSLDDRRRGLALGDVYLDSFPTADSTALLNAMRAGLPVLTWRGQTHRTQTSAAVLIGRGATEQVAVDDAAYLTAARKLATDPVYRAEVKASQQEILSENAALGDALAMADALTALLEKCYDEVATGSSRRHRNPSVVKLEGTAEEIADLRAVVTEQLDRAEIEEALAGTWKLLALDASSSEARTLHAQALRANGRNDQALVYALAALNGHEHIASRWQEVAELLQLNNQSAEAISAYEAVLKLDAGRIDAWLAISELAAKAGHHEFAEEAMATARELNPEDPRVAALATVD